MNSINEKGQIVAINEDRVNDNKRMRNQDEHQNFYLFCVNNYAVLVLFLRYFIFDQVETMFGCFLTVGSTCLSYFLTTDDDGSWNGGSMSWILVSIVVIMPLMESMKFSFQRREEALKTLTSFRTSAQQFYLAHATWDWPTNGRYHDNSDSRDFWLHHSDAVIQELLWIGTHLAKALTRTKTNGHMKITTDDKTLFIILSDDKYSSHRKNNTMVSFGDILSGGMPRLAVYTEILKEYGLEYPEAIRIRNLEMFMTNAIEQLRLYKSYASAPQTLRSFARVFAVCLPPMYGPFFAELSRKITSSVYFGVCLAILASMTLTFLLAANMFLEDPFLSSSIDLSHDTISKNHQYRSHMDGINVESEMVYMLKNDLLNSRAECFPTAEPLNINFII